MARRTILRSLLLCATASCVGIIAASLLAEIFLRTFELAPTNSVVTVTETDFQRVPGIFTPDQNLIDTRIPALPHHVRINSLGYRGEDFPLQKPREELRILMIGDSFTYGDFVNDDQTLPAQLQQRLRMGCENVRVINGGIGGTTIVTHEALAKRAFPLQPDVILITFSENDVDDLAQPLWYSLAENRRQKSAFPLSLLYPTLRRTALWNFALDVRAHLRLRRIAPQPSKEKTTQVTTNDSRRKEYSVALRRLRDSVLERGIVFVFAIYPSHYSVESPARAELVEWAIRVGVSVNVPTINLLIPLRSSRLPIDPLYLLPLDGHPSPEGYKIAAQFLGTELERLEPIQTLCHGDIKGKVLSQDALEPVAIAKHKLKAMPRLMLAQGHQAHAASHSPGCCRAIWHAVLELAAGTLRHT